MVAEPGELPKSLPPPTQAAPETPKEAAQHHAHTMSREEPRGWANTRSFFFGAGATAQGAYDAMGAAIQEAEDVVEGAAFLHEWVQGEATKSPESRRDAAFGATIERLNGLVLAEFPSSTASARAARNSPSITWWMSTRPSTACANSRVRPPSW